MKINTKNSALSTVQDSIYKTFRLLVGDKSRFRTDNQNMTAVEGV